uniref:Ribosomal protein S11 n=1 Tax=Lobosphaera incisa TaxID=312850 RepID=A0A0F7BI77_9CHLO|nr:ribosomal protein S11 [Lobosphaera incisa]AKF78651.1 ribosomal protein S11 [Lobosphaera incisa]
MKTYKKKFPAQPFFSPLKKKSEIGTIYLQSTRNNTILTLVDHQGNGKGWASSGSIGFQHSRKSTTYAAQAAAENIAKQAIKLGIDTVNIIMKGLGYGKQSSVRALYKSGLKVIYLVEKTPIPYNGCRPPKKRRK